MKYQFVDKKFKDESLYIIHDANSIIEEYKSRGYQLTLRQLYYQFVARDLIENSDRQYKRIGSIINNGRLAGLIDWNAIEDRTRVLYGKTDWDSPQQVVRAALSSYHVNRWRFAKTWVEVWVEKDALSEVVGKAAGHYDVSYMACRGYPSQSSVYKAFERFLHKKKYCEKSEFVILYLGDHDPSGIDIPRDIQDRLFTFGNKFNIYVHVKRIALNMDQVKEYNPPPNPAKLSDTRAKSYIEEYGDKSWELDALDPDVITDLIKNHIEDYIVKSSYRKAEKLEREGKSIIEDAVSWMDEREEGDS